VPDVEHDDLVSLDDEEDPVPVVEELADLALEERSFRCEGTSVWLITERLERFLETPQPP